MLFCYVPIGGGICPPPFFIGCYHIFPQARGDIDLTLGVDTKTARRNFRTTLKLPLHGLQTTQSVMKRLARTVNMLIAIPALLSHVIALKAR